MPGQVCSCINSYRLFSHNAFQRKFISSCVAATHFLTRNRPNSAPIMVFFFLAQLEIFGLECNMIHWHMILFIPHLHPQWTVDALILAVKLLATVSPTDCGWRSFDWKAFGRQWHHCVSTCCIPTIITVLTHDSPAQSTSRCCSFCL